MSSLVDLPVSIVQIRLNSFFTCPQETAVVQFQGVSEIALFMFDAQISKYWQMHKVI
ncbi:hypothetical protein B0F87_102128 [Methylobacter tundripaludum]|uniref:Uncharacterized protein n=1 Tax=Methylobacter tundripaludum TaxID=173365 RepID=A0A2S6HHR0_9GAMM|nr:hypothetical protein [Methylobacter tundripaludum]PPK77022.1 hypothetical protein B0F87_102128 [Methylobacter tundripaludum]